jgi:hypothetical protein
VHVLLSIAIALLSAICAEAAGKFTYVENSNLGDRGNYQGVALGDVGEQQLLYLPRQDKQGRLFDVSGKQPVAILNEVAYSYAGNESSAAWGDFDGDGKMELFVARYEQENALLHYDGRGRFQQDIASQLGVNDRGPAQGASWVDYDGDGDLDLFVVNFGAPNVLYQNEDGKAFKVVNVGVEDRGRGVGAAWGDYNADGMIDLYVANFNQANKLYANHGKGQGFEDVAKKMRVADSGPSMSAVWVDYDSDGQWELSVAQNGMPNLLYDYNDGKERFDEVARNLGLGDRGQTQMMAWADYDADGKLDVLTVNGGDQSPDLNRLYHNDGKRFSSVATQLGLEEGGTQGAKFHKGAIWWDEDHDGDLDLFVVTYGQGNMLFRNDDLAKDQRQIVVELVDETGMNRGGAGSELQLWSNDTLQLRYAGIAGNYLSQGSQRAYFGLGVNRADRLIVLWPDGNKQQWPDGNKQQWPSGNNGKVTVQKGRPELVVEPKELHFDGVPVGRSDSRPFFIENKGQGNLEITSIRIEPDNLRSRNILFVEVRGRELPVTVASGAKVTVDVGFVPNGEYLYQGTINIATNAGNDSTEIDGKGIKPGSLVVYNENPAGSITQSIMISGEKGKVKIKNQGSSPVKITDIGIYSNNRSGIAHSFIKIADKPNLHLPCELNGGKSLTVEIELLPNAPYGASQYGSLVVENSSDRLLESYMEIKRYGVGGQSQNRNFGAWSGLNTEWFEPAIAATVTLIGGAMILGSDVGKYERKYNRTLIPNNAVNYKKSAKDESENRNIGVGVAAVGGTYLSLWLWNRYNDNRSDRVSLNSLGALYNSFREDRTIMVKYEWIIR